MSDTHMSQSEALRHGALYYQGNSCKREHSGLRYAKGGGCVECMKERHHSLQRDRSDRRKTRTQEHLASIVRVCKNKTCDKKFTPKKRKDQLFCSSICADREGKRDWKKRNSDRVKEAERERKRKKYKFDSQYRERGKGKSKIFWEKLSVEERRSRGKKYRDKRRQQNPDEVRRYFREYYRSRAKSDIDFRLRGTLRARVRAAFKSQGAQKSSKTMELIGCTIEQLRTHLVDRFEPWMTLDNYGDLWEIDHVIPISSFDLTNLDEQQAACHYLNLQPLGVQENRQKGSNCCMSVT